jgi:DNA-binding protein HU-beta
MTKAELVAAMAKDAGLSKASAEKALNAFIDAVTKALKKKEKVTLVGFCTLSVAKRAARSGINPRTKAKINIKATNVVKFKAGSKLKAAVAKAK